MERASMIIALLMLLAGGVEAVTLDFLGRSATMCDPIPRLMEDPRAQGLERVLNATGLRGMYEDVWRHSGGTVLVPTTEAWVELTEDVGVTLDNLTAAMPSELWRNVLPSYFLTNTSYLPKDVHDTLYQTPSGFFVLMGIYAEQGVPKHSLVASYMNVAQAVVVPGAGARANITRYGTSARVVDFALVCDQYAVYFVDSVFHPFSDPCALTLQGCDDDALLDVEQAVRDVFAAATAPVDKKGSGDGGDDEDEDEGDGEGGGRRLLALEPQRWRLQ